MSSKLIQMCIVLLWRRHLVNSYEVNAGWLISFMDKRVGGWQVKLTVWTLCYSARLSRRWSLFVECKRWTDAFHNRLISMYFHCFFAIRLHHMHAL